MLCSLAQRWSLPAPLLCLPAAPTSQLPCPTPTLKHNHEHCCAHRCALQIALARALKDQHIAERQLVLKAALQDDLDEDLRQAAELPPLPGAGSGGPPTPGTLPACLWLPGLSACLARPPDAPGPSIPHPASACAPAVDKLQKEVDALKEAATALLHRMRYMASRVSEARQLQPGGGQRAQQGEQQPAAADQQQPRLPGGENGNATEGAEAGGASATAAAADGDAGPSAAPPTAAAAAAAAAEGGIPGPSGAYSAEQPGAGLECPVCLTLVPAGADINVFRHGPTEWPACLPVPVPAAMACSQVLQAPHGLSVCPPCPCPCCSGCGHAFCKDCTAKLVLQQGVCAVCRHKVTAKSVFRVAAGGGSGSGACDPEFEALGNVSGL